MDSIRGHFLVASPRLADANFYQSVVLMIQHDEEGAFGVVLNRPTDKLVADLWSFISPQPCTCRDPIHLGGPVSGPLVAIHSNVAQSELEVVSGVYYASDREAIVEIVSHPQGPFRLFIGYAGWGGGQLDGEMQAGGWLNVPAQHDDIFSDSADIWKRVKSRIGMDILSPAIRRRDLTDDPSLN